MRNRDYPILSKKQKNAFLSKKATLNDGVTGQYISIPSASVATARGIMLWFKPLTVKNNSLSSQETIIDYDESSFTELGRVDVSFQTSGILSFVQRRISDAAHFRCNSTRTEWKAGEWYHLCIHTNSVRGMELYINGVLNDTNSGLKEAYRDVLSTLNIGGNITVNSRFCDIEIKQLKIIEGDISQEDVISEMTYKPTGLESYIKEFWDFENYTSGTSDGVNENTATFVNPLGSPNDLIFNTPVTDYYAISLNSINQENIILPNAFFGNVRTALLKLKFPYDITPSTNTQFIFEQSTNGIYSGRFSLSINNGKFWIQQATDTAGSNYNLRYQIFSDSDTFNKDKWYYFAYIVDPSTGMRMLIDNTQQADTDSYSSAISNNNIPCRIGSRYNNTLFSTFEIKDIVLFSIALDNQTIEDYEHRKFNGTETGLIWHSQKMQGKGNKIYDFKDTSEATLNSTRDTDEMWVLSKNTIIPNITFPWEQIGTNILLGEGLIGYTADTVGFKGGNFKWIPKNTDFEISYNITQYYGNVGNQSSVSCGFAEINTNSDIFLYEFGVQVLYLSATGNIQFRVCEDGLIPGLNLATVVIGDKISIKRTGNVITYLLNDVVLYTSSKTTTKQFLVNFSLYADYGAENIKLTYKYQ